MTDVPDETEAAWVRRFSGITHAQAETLMADTRDKRRARLTHDSARAAHSKQVMVCVDSADLRDELEDSKRDREALAVARELLSDWLCGLRPRKKIDAFLKRTEPTDD